MGYSGITRAGFPISISFVSGNFQKTVTEFFLFKRRSNCPSH